MYDDFGVAVEGEMTVPNQQKDPSQGSEPEFNTLDEPIKETVVRKTSKSDVMYLNCSVVKYVFHKLG